ncbi:hypothetical protein ABW21_db0204677 [Orbilia brochopaga]|nr:hypothetical protein ABW21_db0204677 [Drechslerella brochopaga]
MGEVKPPKEEREQRVEDWIASPDTVIDDTNELAEGDRPDEDEGEDRNFEKQSEHENKKLVAKESTTPWPQDQIKLDFGLDSLFTEFKDMDLETALLKSEANSIKVTHGEKDTDHDQAAQAESTSSNLGSALQELLEETLSYWGQRADDATIKRLQDNKGSWQSTLKTLNMRWHGDRNINRCMKDKDIFDLLEFLEILSHEYHVHCRNETEEAHQSRRYIAEELKLCLHIFVSDDDINSRHRKFVNVKTRICDRLRRAWEQEFRKSWNRLGDDLRSTLIGGTLVRNYYAPLSGQCINIYEFSQDHDVRAYKLLPNFRINIDGTVTHVERTPEEDEYIWREGHSPSSSPPTTPPDETSFKKGIKFDGSWFDENGTFIISAGLFFIVNARSRPCKRKNDDESLLIIDTSFMAAMNQYVKEFAEIVGGIVEESVRENLPLNPPHVFTLATFLATELKSRLALNEDDTLADIESLTQPNIFSIIWDQVNPMLTTAKKHIALQPYVTKLETKLLQHLYTIYAELRENDKVTIEVQSDTTAAAATQGLATHDALSAPAVRAGNLGTLRGDDQATEETAGQ